MKIMVVGGGGREHAHHPHAEKEPARWRRSTALPGNGGIAAGRHLRGHRRQGYGRAWSTLPGSNAIDFAVVAPDDPLVLGAVDRAGGGGHPPASAPDRTPPILEGSKVFSKDLMKKYGIPTAAYEVFDGRRSGAWPTSRPAAMPTVIKADGLALGKGVIIAQNRAGGRGRRCSAMMEDKVFGDSGNQRGH